MTKTKTYVVAFLGVMALLVTINANAFQLLFKVHQAIANNKLNIEYTIYRTPTDKESRKIDGLIPQGLPIWLGHFNDEFKTIPVLASNSKISFGYKTTDGKSIIPKFCKDIPLANKSKAIITMAADGCKISLDDEEYFATEDQNIDNLGN